MYKAKDLCIVVYTYPEYIEMLTTVTYAHQLTT